MFAKSLFAAALILSVGLIWADRRVGLADVVPNERVNTTCPRSEGYIPLWLNGYFVRQSCGAFGNVTKGVPGEYVDHLFDCMSQAVTFKFSGGNVEYSNKFYETRPFKLWEKAGRDMQKSKVAWGTVFASMDLPAVEASRKDFKDFYDSEPNVDFWKVGNTVLAVTEGPTSYEFDVPTLAMKGQFAFGDQNFDLGNQTFMMANPAHEQIDPDDGTMWSTAFGLQINSDLTIGALRIIYKISPGSNKRVVVGKHDLGLLDLSKCDPKTWQFNDPSMHAKLGYMHSFVMTKRFIVLPLTSYFMNPCFLVPGSPADMPFFKTWYAFDKNVPMQFLLMDKTTGVITVGPTTATVGNAYFVTHTINAYEDSDGSIVADMIAYEDANAYMKYTYVDFLKSDQMWPAEAMVLRFRLSGATIEKTSLTGAKFTTWEFPQINHLFTAKDYTFVYSVVNPFSDDSGISQLNVKTGRIIEWFPGKGIYVGEPVFVQRPSTGVKGETDGVILVGVLDSNRKQGGVFVLHANDLSVLGSAYGPDVVPFGLHNRFYSFSDLGRGSANALSGGFALSVIVGVLLAFFY